MVMNGNYDFPDEIMSDGFGKMTYRWDGMNISDNAGVNFACNIAGYCCDTSLKEYFIKALKDGSFGIYTDKMAKHKVGMVIKSK